MRLTKRQLKRIIREEYSRLKKQGLLRESAQGLQWITLGDIAQLTGDSSRDLLGDAEQGLGGIEFFEGGGYGDDWIGGSVQQLESFIGLPASAWMDLADSVGPQDHDDFIGGRASASDYSYKRRR
tara:strand:- start:211 stop:585 length:375 start_codon:yes stop_codon:yes gene_type:complete